MGGEPHVVLVVAGPARVPRLEDRVVEEAPEVEHAEVRDEPLGRLPKSVNRAAQRGVDLAKCLPKCITCSSIVYPLLLCNEGSIIDKRMFC